VLVECQPELVRLLQSCAGVDQVSPAGSVLATFDVHAPLLSLPGILKTTLATVPAAVPYVRADEALARRWHQELGTADEFKIGIVWQGNPSFGKRGYRAADQKRSIPLAQFESLARVPDVRLFSLQKGYGREQLAGWQSENRIVDLGDRLGDFMDTAAVMMNLDLIISADTSPLHLAGALGRPVWAALPVAPCWRWLLEREDSPWYPTMRLFRQRRRGDWSEVVERMAVELEVRSKK
jgi:glycosyl transferase family 9 (putative heptosyltransferase)